MFKCNNRTVDEKTFDLVYRTEVCNMPCPLSRMCHNMEERNYK